MQIYNSKGNYAVEDNNFTRVLMYCREDIKDIKSKCNASISYAVTKKQVNVDKHLFCTYKVYCNIKPDIAQKIFNEGRRTLGRDGGYYNNGMLYLDVYNGIESKYVSAVSSNLSKWNYVVVKNIKTGEESLISREAIISSQYSSSSFINLSLIHRGSNVTVRLESKVSVQDYLKNVEDKLKKEQAKLEKQREYRNKIFESRKIEAEKYVKKLDEYVTGGKALVNEILNFDKKYSFIKKGYFLQTNKDIYVLSEALNDNGENVDGISYFNLVKDDLEFITWHGLKSNLEIDDNCYSYCKAKFDVDILKELCINTNSEFIEALQGVQVLETDYESNEGYLGFKNKDLYYRFNPYSNSHEVKLLMGKGNVKPNLVSKQTISERTNLVVKSRGLLGDIQSLLSIYNNGLNSSKKPRCIMSLSAYLETIEDIDKRSELVYRLDKALKSISISNLLKLAVMIKDR